MFRVQQQVLLSEQAYTLCEREAETQLSDEKPAMYLAEYEGNELEDYKE